MWVKEGHELVERPKVKSRCSAVVRGQRAQTCSTTTRPLKIRPAIEKEGAVLVQAKQFSLGSERLLNATSRRQPVGIRGVSLAWRARLHKETEALGLSSCAAAHSGGVITCTESLRGFDRQYRTIRARTNRTPCINRMGRRASSSQSNPFPPLASLARRPRSSLGLNSECPLASNTSLAGVHCEDESLSNSPSQGHARRTDVRLAWPSL
jgi:hypothetical protein